jgi:hypothetical protein
MSEWWTYRPADLLMFSARSYARLFELHHAALWPTQALVLAFGLLIAVLVWRRHPQAHRVALVGLALGWAAVGFFFHLQRYAAIQTAAPWFAAAFGVQGLLMLAAAWRGAAPGTIRRRVGLGLMIFAALGMPLLGLALARPLGQLECVGLTPDATVVATLGALLLVRAPWAWPIPLAWVAIGATTLWTLASPDWWWMPAAAVVAAVVAIVGTQNRK